MPIPRHSRSVRFLALALLLPLAGCITRPVDSLPVVSSEVAPILVPARPNNQVDILFVIDNSGSMAEEQQNLGRNFATFVSALKDRADQPLDYRIGVVSTDVGVGGYAVDMSSYALCNRPGLGPDQDNGQLQTRLHADPADWEASQAGLFACGDVALGLPAGDPALCDTLRQGRQYLVDSCAGLELDPKAPFITRNDRSDEEVARHFRCIGSLGVNGCFIEQPLEAARRALTGPQPFLRPGALLAVVFITDETDCSVRDPSLFEPNGAGFSSDDPGLRCYLDARRCDGQQQGMLTSPDGSEVDYTSYSSCQDNERYLRSVDEYVQALKDLKPDGRVVVAGIAGAPDYTAAPPLPLGPGPQDASVALIWQADRSGPGRGIIRPSPSCSSAQGTAVPNPRLQRLLEAFPDRTTGQANFVSICSADFSPALQQFARAIVGDAERICVTLPEEARQPDVDPNTLCVIDERRIDGTVRGAIRASEGWQIRPASPECFGGASPDQVVISPELRETFGIGSQLFVTCVR